MEKAVETQEVINMTKETLDTIVRRKEALNNYFNECSDPHEMDCLILELKAVEAWENFYRHKIKELQPVT